MRRIFAFIVIAAMVLSLCPTIVSATDKAQILTPADGSVVYDTLDKIIFYVSTQCDVTAYLDGEEKTVRCEDDLYYIDIEENLSVGAHTVEVVCIDDYGSSYAKSTFNFAGTTQTKFISENFDSGDAGKMQFNSKFKVGTNEAGEDVHLIPGFYTGKGGDEKGAVGIYRDVPVTNVTVSNSSSTYIYIVTSALALTGRVILEYDIRVDGGCECGIETKNAQNQFGTIGSSRLFAADGYIKDTDFEYKKGEWMHVKHIVDVPNGVEDMWIDGEQVYDKRSHTSSTPTNRIMIIRFQIFEYGTQEPYGFAIDNVFLGQENAYEGFKDISFKNEAGEFETAENDVVSKVTDELKVKVVIPGFSVNQTTMPKVYCNDKPLELESAELDSDGYLLLKLKEAIPKSGKIKIESSVPFGDGHLDVKKEFSVFAEDFGVSDVKFAVDDVFVRNTKQLTAQKSLNTKAMLENNTSSPQSAVVVTTVYSGKKLAAMKACSVTVEAESVVEADCGDITIPDGENYSIECFMFDGYMTRKAVSGIWKIFDK